MSPNAINVLFTRFGTDSNLNAFRHELVYSGAEGMEKVFVISEGRDQSGSSFREEWEHSESADEIARLLIGNKYLSLTLAEFEG